MDLELAGKAAVVTGGSRGMGFEIARQLALEGADVAIVARGIDALEDAARKLAEETGRRVFGVVGDTGDDESVRQMAKEAAERLGRIDILVNNAAYTEGASIVPTVEEFTTDMFWPAVNVKVLGYWRCARELVPYMKRHRWGRIINIAGLGARESGAPVVAMRNAATIALGKNLADELGAFGINVTTVLPGITKGPSMETAFGNPQHREFLVRLQEGTRRHGDPALDADDTARGVSRAEAEKRVIRSISIRRLVDQTEVAYIVAFLASPKSVAISGDVIPVGGGDGRAIYY